MKCPICTTVDLVMTERQGVEIDYCPICRGIWLDRGELVKIIERSYSKVEPAAPVSLHYPRTLKNATAHHHGDEHHRGDHKKHKSWIGELFD